MLAACADEANGRPDLADAIDALRAALAGKSARNPAAPRSPREGTKLMTVLAML
ncbi:hypothetical protein [Falsiroseomonas sp.]|uniref:hypothetical protein n=1 Tax=Falsiroseomonas sp. TaxID=2870721 RepID=UPI00356361FE